MKINNIQVKYALLFVLIFAFIVLGYSHLQNPNVDYTQPKSKIINQTCPSQEFSDFLKEFSENQKTQMVFIKYPLKQQSLDLNAEPEPKPVISELQYTEIKFPIIPNEVARKANSLSLRIDEVTTKQAKVTIFRNDSDYQVSYFFNKNSCWELERVEDWSL
jgi:hypothetical protein